MKKVDLVIMAAGLGSRFGGLKQLEEVGSHQATLLDYAIFDAKKIGIHNIYIVVRDSFNKAIQKSFQKKWKDMSNIFFINQEIEDIPITLSSTRQKPWGTTHVLYALRNTLKNSFIIMNADDFYGRGALETLKENLSLSENEKEQCMIAYDLEKTLSTNGKVTRGICEVKKGFLEQIHETRGVEKLGEKIVSNSGEIKENSLVSMNIWGLTPYFLKLAIESTVNFFKEVDFKEKEILLPMTIQERMQSKEIAVKVLASTQECFGMTFKEDLKLVQGRIQKLTKEKIYPYNIFESS